MRRLCAGVGLSPAADQVSRSHDSFLELFLQLNRLLYVSRKRQKPKLSTWSPVCVRSVIGVCNCHVHEVTNIAISFADVALSVTFVSALYAVFSVVLNHHHPHHHHHHHHLSPAVDRLTAAGCSSWRMPQ